MNYKCNTAVLISVKELDARKICERVESTFIEDFDNHSEFKDLNPNHFEVYSLTNFMDLLNDESYILTKYFVTFVNTPE